jgi:uncharacterized membrane protein
MKKLFIIILLIGSFISVSGSFVINKYQSSVESEIAVNQLSDDINTNTISRELIKGDYMHKTGFVLCAIGFCGFIYTVTKRKEKKDE